MFETTRKREGRPMAEERTNGRGHRVEGVFSADSTQKARSEHVASHVRCRLDDTRNGTVEMTSCDVDVPAFVL